MQILEDIAHYKMQFFNRKITARYFWRVYKALRKEFYASIEWQEVRREVRKRDCVCVQCGDPGRDVDHILTLYDRPDLALDPTNLRYICLKCHKRKHRKLNKGGRLSKRMGIR